MDEIAHDEFECSGCGETVFSFPPVIPPPTRCSVCVWLDTYIEDEDEREELRARLI